MTDTSSNTEQTPPAEAQAPVASAPAADGAAEAVSAPGSEAPGSEAPSSEAPSSEAPHDGADAAEAPGDAEGATQTPGDAEGATQTPGDAEGATQTPGSGRKRRPKKKKPDPTQSPFGRFFQGAAGRKHAFAVGEAVAGRVVRIEHGVIAIDLFGKAMAFADEHEPREVPAQPALAPEAAGVAPVVPQGESPAAVETAPSTEASAEAEPALPSSDGSEASPSTGAAEPEAPSASEEGAADAAAAEPEEPHASEEGAADAAADAADATDSAEGEPHDAEPHGPLAPLPVVSEDLPRLEPPAIGHIFRGRVGAVSESGHIVIVNRNVDSAEARAALERCREQRRRVQALVFGFNRGGFDVLVGGLRGFCPARSMSLEPIEDPEALLGRELEFLIPATQKLAKDVVVGRRSILEREQRKRAREVLRGLTPGQRAKGRVTHVLEFGLVVDLGGAEGLVHQSELSWVHGVRPGDVAKPGDEVEVQVLRVGDPQGKSSGRRERLPRLSLSIKALEADPWQGHVEHLKEGSVQNGTVTRVTEFGAFVALAPAVEGLLHVSELGRDVRHAGDVLKEGEELPVVVDHIDVRARRISLSKPSASEVEDWKQGKLDVSRAPRDLHPGGRVKVLVERVEHHGLLVRVAGVAGRKARGFLAKADLGGGRDGDHRKSHPVGSEIEVKIVGFGRDGGLKCSVKALEIDDERRAVKDYRREASKQGFGTFGDLLRAKIGGGAK